MSIEQVPMPSDPKAKEAKQSSEEPAHKELQTDSTTGTDSDDGETVDCDDEEFKTIKENPKYEINRSAQIRHKKQRKIRQPVISGYGALTVNLGKLYQVHRLIASAFIPNEFPEEKPHVFHENGDITDNSIKNLRWGNQKDVVQNYVKTHPRAPTRGGVFQKSLTGEIWKEHESAKAAAEDNKTKPEDIRNACNRGQAHQGFLYSYMLPSQAVLADPKLRWKRIQLNDEPSNYSVTRGGLVKNNKTGKLMKQHTFHAYNVVHLTHRLQSTHPAVHILVANAFLKRKNPGDEVDHIDRNKRNNSASNLRFISKRGNCAAANGKKVSKTNIKSGKVVDMFESIRRASEDAKVSKDLLAKRFSKGKTYKTSRFVYRLANKKTTSTGATRFANLSAAALQVPLFYYTIVARVRRYLRYKNQTGVSEHIK